MTWTLLDYGVGNLHSLQKALEAAGAQVDVTDDASAWVEADVAVLPGVGAFGHVMARLAPIADAVRARHHAGRPMLGVCIGMQVLYDGSEEAPGVAGLGILDGVCKRIPDDAGKVPHMGWNTLDGAIGLAAQAQGHVYYVHTYAAPASGPVQATTDYGFPFAAAVEDGNTVAFQFHPEKSSAAGARILKATVARLESVCN